MREFNNNTGRGAKIAFTTIGNLFPVTYVGTHDEAMEDEDTSMGNTFHLVRDGVAFNYKGI
jgi:hypothetical protein